MVRGNFHQNAIRLEIIYISPRNADTSYLASRFTGLESEKRKGPDPERSGAIQRGGAAHSRQPCQKSSGHDERAANGPTARISRVARCG